jgi:hypothetical protein
MRKFKARGWYDMKSGLVASVFNDEDYERDTKHLIGEIVSIDGQTYKVRGVESDAIQTIRTGMPIGLWVEPFTAIRRQT